jgi:thiazole synthase
MSDYLKINNRVFESRLFIGTGKFSSSQVMKKAISASKTQMVTVALRRVNLNNPNDNILNNIDLTKYHLLPNTSGAQTAEEAIRLAMLSRESSENNWIKLEVTPNPINLLPDSEETLKASKYLIKEGFIVLPYIQADPILAKKLEDIGTATVMPLGSPIGSNKGLQTKAFLRIIIENSNIPVVIDAGLGSPSHACEAMEMGADAVLVNTAIATAEEPIKLAKAFSKAVSAGRDAFLSGLPPVSDGEASSPLSFLIK